MIESLSIVVPAYNEAACIEATVADALRVGAIVTPRLEVIVCNDGSRDQTGAILERLALRDPRLRVLDRRKNRGIEASIRALYACAHHEWIFLNSADRQAPMEILIPMAEAAARGADLVLGVRSNKAAVYTPYRRAISWSFDAIVRALGAPEGDPGSIKLGRRALLDVPVVATGVFSEGERVVRAARAGAKVASVPVEFRARESGKATGARRDVVARAAIDAIRVTSSLALGWPRPVAPEPDV
jgi:glycosyltransferase involved in cell wall biosynthesis